MFQAVRVEHENSASTRITLVDWRFGNRCNYKCSYCPANLHDGTLGWQTFGDIIIFCDRLIAHYGARGQSVLFQFSGGEPTVYARFLDLLTYLRQRQCRVALISNGSRSLAWWHDARLLLDQAVLTHHIEFVDIAHFIRVTQSLAARLRTHVNITMLPERFADCLHNAQRIAAECADITLTLKPLLVDFGAELYPYTPAQKAVLRDTRFAIRRTRPPDSGARGNMRLTDANGASETRKASHLIVDGQNRWQGWQCHAGLELLAIDMQGDVWRGTCRQGGRLGHITDAHIAFPDTPVLCQKAVCHCATDIMTTKTRT